MTRNLIAIIFISLLVNQSSFSQQRETVVLRDGWKFHKGHSDMAWSKDFDDSGWENVKLPHDWAIYEPFIPDGNGDTGKLPWKGEGWYRKSIDIPLASQGRSIFILCDGIMAFPEIFVNGKPAGKWDYGYNSFYIDITPFIIYGSQNMIAIHADTRKHDGRWYPGAGIYRKVTMITMSPVHADIWGTYITTPLIEPGHSAVNIETAVTNNSSSDTEINVEQVIYTPDGTIAGKSNSSSTLKAGASIKSESRVEVDKPLLWDTGSPTLYSLVTNIYANGKLTDSSANKFGIRKMKFTADDGFWLNDRRVQLKGVNLHHDLGLLGAAFNKRAMERRLELLKEMGCNAIRTSHNVAAPELLDLCDRMGLLVFDEVFDKYDGKADITDTTNFESFARRNIRNFITRDRNHPSVFIWSVGNEIGDVQWNKDNGFMKLQTMVRFTREYDNTRPVTLVCDSRESARLRHFDYYDVHSWNYGRRYSLARELEPNKSVIISESASTVSSRGFYELPLPEKKTDFTKSLQVSSYDMNAPEWAEIADDDFMWQQDEPYVAGEFVWTGFDYLGEPTPYNNRGVKAMGMTDREASHSSYFGIFDLCGIPKDRYYLYKSHWRPDEVTVHILPHWNWEERTGKNVPVFVYTNGDSAELFLNGKSLGKRYKDPSSSISTERFRLMWKDVIYEPGELKAVAYLDGVKIGEDAIRTAGKPLSLKLTADREVVNSGGEDLAYITVEAFDSNGNLCPLANNSFEIKITGDGALAGAGNGDPQSLTTFYSSTQKLFYGKAMIIISPGMKKGKILVEVLSPGLKKSKISIRVNENSH